MTNDFSWLAGVGTNPPAALDAEVPSQKDHHSRVPLQEMTGPVQRRDDEA